ncbi:hypothetical protein GCM10023231_01380 [Olivibacter ginsenosidimutans]|uniref:Fido domain-containing protein n=1 Tax=Olivibacter ginsenosidimutans TaxID=1176537 RepID=A0ABP9ACK9_9SPHI
MEPIEQAILLKQELDSLRPLNNEAEALIMQKFRLDWNYNSNSLEGNSLTFGETKALILHGITAQGKPLKDHFEITGHDEAIKWVTDVVKGDHPLTESFIRELHTLLLKEPYDVDAITPEGQPTRRRIAVGRYKTAPNHVLTKTGEVFRFATPEETPAKMHDLLEWYRAESGEEDVNPVILAAEFHYRFILIHPFDDGNGRTARILMNFILMKSGYPPVIIKTDDKANYFSALQQADSGNIKVFVDYIAENLVHSLDIMIAGAKGENIEDPDDALKELALLKHHLKKEHPTKSPKIILETFTYFEEKIKPFFTKAIQEVEELFDEIKEQIYIDGREYNELKSPLAKALSNPLIEGMSSITNRFRESSENIKVFGRNLYTSPVSNITWKYRCYGLKGAKSEKPLNFSYTLSFSTTHYTIKLYLNDKKQREVPFLYDAELSENDLRELGNKFLKIIVIGIKQSTNDGIA